MLNREKVAQDILSIISKLFPDVQGEHDLAKAKWAQIAQDRSFPGRVEAAQSSFLIPRWEGNLTDSVAINPDLKKYKVLAVDGSQIYPDRHVAGAGCFLINAGGVMLEYGAGKANFFSKPSVLTPSDILESIGGGLFSRDLVDLKREEYEFAMTVEKALEQEDFPVCLVDGSIVFWQLDSKAPEVKDFFLERYRFISKSFMSIKFLCKV